MRLVLAESARRHGLAASDWSSPRPGYRNPLRHSHRYGFGLVDAAAAVALAHDWALLPAQKVFPPPVSSDGPDTTRLVASPIPKGDTEGLADTLWISGSGINFIEWVDIEFASSHSYAGNLEITLTSPAGTVSRLALPHGCRNSRSGQWIADCTGAITGPDGVWRWRFGSARHLGEAADGAWTLRVVDAVDQPFSGSGDWQSWRLIIRGH